MDTESLPYRPCVGVALFNRNGDVFVGERIDTPGAWQMPQGGIDPGEAIKGAALRELKEEIGTDKAQVIKTSSDVIRYDLPPDLMGKLWNGKYRGQEQYWVAALFTGNDSDIDIEHHELPEFLNWKWIPLQQTLELIVPFKREVYRQVIAMFSDIKLPQ